MRGFWLLLLLLMFEGLHGSVETFRSIRSGSEISEGVVIDLEDLGHYGGGPLSAKVLGRKGVIKLYFTDALQEYRSYDWSMRVSYSIDYEYPDGSTGSLDSYLEILGDAANTGTTKSIDLDIFGGMSRLKIRIDTVMFRNLNSFQQITAIPADFHFEVALSTERYYSLESGSDPGITQASYQSSNNTLDVSWGFLEGAESYELEWVYVADGDTSSGNHLSESISYDFRNATRVSLNDQCYNIPLSYPKGSIIYRVRGVGRDLTSEDVRTSLVYSDWSYDPGTLTVSQANSDNSASPCHYYFTGVDNDKNWTYVASYAEDGKRKEVASYVDGSGRNRQQVTVINSDGLAIVGESVYDYVGRAAVNILPVPTTNEGLKYYGTSVNPFNGDWDRDNFATDAHLNESNGVLPESLPTSSGANQYYSSSNSLEFQNKDALPDGEGYPYVFTQYTNDGTERVKAMSGLGETMRYKAQGGHMLRNFYVTPSQVELDRLFGLEVGDAKYYQKVITIDPNGQVSVQYLDAGGQVIATALAGPEPANMTKLENNSSSSVQTSLFSGAMPLPRNGEILQSYGFSSTSPQTVNMDYNLDQVNFVTCRQGSSTISSPEAYRIPYDVELVVHNERGDSLKGWSHQGVKSMNAPDTLSFEASVGTKYTISRRIRMNEDSLAAFIALEDSLMDLTKHDSLSCGPNYQVSSDTLCEPIDCDSACVGSHAFYIDSILYFTDSAGNIYEPDSSGLYFTSSDSSTTYTNYFTDTTASSPFGDAIRDCKERCKDFVNDENQEGVALYYFFTEDQCGVKSSAMQANMSPGGQYFNPSRAGIYDSSGYLVNDSCYLELGGGTLSNPLWDTICEASRVSWLEDSLPGALDSINNLFGANFSDWGSLQRGWDASYGSYFMQYHPEYCAYEYFCNYSYSCGATTITMDSLRRFIGSMFRVDSLSNSQSGGFDFMDPLNFTNTSSTGNILADQSAYIRESSGSSLVDPLVCTSGSGTLGSYANGQLADYLKDFVPVLNTSGTHLNDGMGNNYYYSLWYLLDDPDNIADGNGGFNTGLHRSIVDLFNAFHGDGDCWDGLIASDQEKLLFFRNIYLFYREKIIYDYFTEYYQCTNTGSTYTYWDADTNYDGILDDGTYYNLVYPKNPVYDYYGANSTTLDSLYNVIGEDPDIYLVISARDSCSREALITYLEEASLYDGGTQSLLVSNAIVLDSINTRYCLNYSLGELDSLMLLVNDTNFSHKYLIPEELRCNFGRSFPADTVDQCSLQKTLLAHQEAERQYQLEKTAYLDSIKVAYEKAAYDALESIETVQLNYVVGEYHYTLYYYDRAGNLTKTIPPAGVDTLSPSEAAAVDVYRRTGTGGTPNTPEHTYVTNYHYNAQNQLITQFTPDGDSTFFWYDLVGRLVVSQNAKQREQSPPEYSYTIYDGLSRIAEVGKLATDSVMADSVASNQDMLKRFIYSAANRQEITFTIYDQTLADLNPSSAKAASVSRAFNGKGQQFLRNRVASTFYLETLGANFDTAFVFENERMDSLPIQYLYYSTASHYSYDPHGNVNRYVQEIDELDSIYGHGFFSVDYQYDLVSGNVNKVAYQAGEVDQFYHRYSYDADNRIRTVYTSPDDITYSEDARYFYYPHGPLSRVELGGQNVQGLDYAYTLQGWLKSVNGASLGAGKELGLYDLGGDGHQSEANANFGADAFGYQLDYFNGDYQAIGADNFTASISGGSNALNTEYKNLYNGNIGRMITVINDNVEDPMAVSANLYQYDQLNRIASFVAFEDTSLNRHNQSVLAKQMGYRSNYAYDPNGNITALNRYNGSGLIMDSLSYTYEGQVGTTDLYRNRLKHVDDVAGVVNTVDLGDQASNNYDYDAIGNLTKDVSNGIDAIDWNVQGKVSSIQKGSHYINFMYDPMGNRVKKEDTEDARSTYYVRDAQGNVMATYVDSGATFKLGQQMLYGSSRLGLRNREISISSAYTTTTSSISGVAKGVYHFNSKGNSNTIYVNPNSSPGTYWLEAVEGQVKVASTVTPLAGTHDTISGYYVLEEGDYMVYSSTGDDIISSGRFKLQSDEDFTGTGFSGTYHQLNPEGEELGLKNYELSNHLGNVLSTVSDRKIWKAYTGIEYTLRTDSFPDLRSSSSLTTDTDEWTLEDGEAVSYSNVTGGVLFEPQGGSYISRSLTPSGSNCNYQYCINLEFEEGEVLIEITENSGSTTILSETLSSSGERCFNISQFGSGSYTVNLYPDEGTELTLTGESLTWVSLPAGWEQVNGCAGSTANGGLTLYYHSGASSQHQINTQEDIDPTCDQTFCFNVAALSGAGSMIVKNQSGSTLTTVSIEQSAGPDYCVNLSNTSADSLNFVFTMTSGSYMTISDIELRQSCDQTLQVANVIMAQDYYPFGMVMPGRSYQGSDAYRYGFQGQEKDDEIAGSGNSYTALFWQYDSRLGRRWNLDPKPNPSISQYATFANNPIIYTDILGDTTEFYNLNTGELLGTVNDTGGLRRVKIYEPTYIGTTSSVNDLFDDGFMSSDEEQDKANFMAASIIGAGELSELLYEGTNYISFGTGDIYMIYNAQILEGSTLDGYNGSGQYSQGVLETYASFDDGTNVRINSTPARSGPYGDGYISAGEWVTGPFYTWGRSGASFSLHGIEFKFDIHDNEGKAIHPDGGTKLGTRSCIGLYGTRQQISDWNKMMRQHMRLSDNADVPLTVDNNE